MNGIASEILTKKIVSIDNMVFKVSTLHFEENHVIMLA